MPGERIASRQVKANLVSAGFPHWPSQGMIDATVIDSVYPKEVEMSCKEETISPKAGLVVMMCGIAGSGKTTFAQDLETKGFQRLSIDEVIWEVFGKFGIDYEESAYTSHQEKARAIIEEKLVQNLMQGHAIVLDLSFWSKSERDRVKEIIVKNGGHPQIVYLKVPEGVLRERLTLRSRRFDANAAFTITDNILNRYLHGFEEPIGEGEFTIETTTTKKSEF